MYVWLLKEERDAVWIIGSEDAIHNQVNFAKQKT